MSTTAPRPEGGSPGPDTVDHRDLSEMRARIAAGMRLTGPPGERFIDAVHTIDPTATEDTLAVLPGGRGIHLYDTLVSWSPITAGERVLDIGCGSGGATRSAARAVGPTGSVLGIDRNEACLAVARQRTADDLPVRYRRGDLRSMPFVNDRSIDCVVASMVLDEIEDLTPALAEIYRVLRPGGRLVASVWAFDNWRPMDAAFMGSAIAVVGSRAPGTMAGRSVRAGIPHDARDRRAFAACGLASLEEQEAHLAAIMENGDQAWALFSRTMMARALDDEGQDALRAKLVRRLPHTLFLPMRFLRTRRPG